MSRFRHEIVHLQAHIRTLRLAAGALALLALLLGLGWWSAPRDLTIHIPPDLRSGSTRRWWDVPPENVYAFAFYIWQQLQRWPSDGEADYPRNLKTLSAYLTPACQAFLEQDYQRRRANGELRLRVRGVYEIPGRGYGEDPARRVKVISPRDWLVTLDLTADEYYSSEQIKRALHGCELAAEEEDGRCRRDVLCLAQLLPGGQSRGSLPLYQRKRIRKLSENAA
jgi:integrating conjugative element protein (TIGR03746 family)